MQPLPCRPGVNGNSEGNSEIDLMLGDLSNRKNTTAGVGYSQPDNSDGRACLVEAKWLSDIACKTTHDWERNQLARVIETALTFQGNLQFPDRIHVTLLTPAVFKNHRDQLGSRLYCYKWHEYTNQCGRINADAIKLDIDRSCIPSRPAGKVWSCPDLDQRLEKLHLHWVTYEDVINSMPETEFKAALFLFIQATSRNVLQIGAAT